MIVLLDTSTGLCQLRLVLGDETHDYEWQADRQLAKGLLAFIREKLALHGKELADIQGIGVMQGPGSFTGLRIGMTVCNTLADSLGVPIVGETGEGWQVRAIDRLKKGDNDRVVLPIYGGEANITKPRK
jgi:tRNA threonylcarbamoyladenosine biosynthesis protein TsaB